jgi:phosphatidate cytidylyltransferase
LLTTRIITAAVLVAVVLVCVLWLPSYAMAVAFGVAWAAGAWEWGRLVGWSGIVVWVYAALVVVLGAVGNTLLAEGSAATLAVLVSCWWLGAFVGVVAYPWRVPAALVAGAGVVALVPSWLVLVSIHASGVRGPVLVLSLLCVVWAADVGAYFCGRTFGRVKLAPSVSPGKTWEGVAGGLAAATVVGVAAGMLLGQAAAIWALIAFATAVVSIVGDLTVSLCKRQAGTKDSSHLLPGHGGVLDRIDSLTAAAPIFFLGLSLAGLLP